MKKTFLLFIAVFIIIVSSTQATEFDKHNEFRISAYIEPAEAGDTLEVWFKVKNNDPYRKVSVTLHSLDIDLFHSTSMRLSDDESQWSTAYLDIPVETRRGLYYLTIRVNDPDGPPNEKIFKKHIPFFIY